MSSKETIAGHIMKKYFELEQVCRRKIGDFPMVDTYSMEPVDLVNLLLTYFNKDYETQDYLPTLKMYAKFRGVDECKLEPVYPDIQKFITETLTLLKNKEL